MKRRLLALPLLVPLFAGCGVSVASTADPGSAQPSQTATPLAADVVPGYERGQFPAIPMFTMPDLSMLDSSMAGFSIKVRDSFPSVPGVTIKPARCDKSGDVATDDGSLTLYGDGSGDYTGPDGSISNYGNGAGSYTINGKTVNVYGNGAGDYTGGGVRINSYGNGAGDYADGTVSINIYGTGSGDYKGNGVIINNYGNGAGDYKGNGVIINNYGNGAGDYKGNGIIINNYGNGIADVTGPTGESTTVAAPPIKPIPALGTFPNMGVLKPITSCGTRIIIDDSVLFDFNADTLRPQAQQTVTKLAAVFTKLAVKTAVVSGHTDSIGTDSYNQDLSERRAQSVVDALKTAGVGTTLEAKGYGESKPIAPNQIKGVDNPSGRQLNRRVEIFIPS